MIFGAVQPHPLLQDLYPDSRPAWVLADPNLNSYQVRPADDMNWCIWAMWVDVLKPATDHIGRVAKRPEASSIGAALEPRLWLHTLFADRRCICNFN
jgi:hypothetical protein